MASIFSTLKTRLGNDAARFDDALLKSVLSSAGQAILARRYPFDMPEDADVPEIYEDLQVRIAIEMISRMGAEGETSHSENGVQRLFESGNISPSLLAEVVPKVGILR